MYVAIKWPLQIFLLLSAVLYYGTRQVDVKVPVSGRLVLQRLDKMC